MKRRHHPLHLGPLILLILFFLNACSEITAPSLDPSTWASGMGSVSGNVVNRKAGTDIENVKVALVGTEISTTTDAHGFYRLFNFPAGYADLSFSKDTPIKPKPLEPKGYTISGDVQYWYFGDLVLRAETTDADGNIVVIATSRIAEDGTFSITLPTTSKSFAAGRYNEITRPCKDVYVGERGPVVEVSGPGHVFTPDPFTSIQVDLYAYEDVKDTSSYIELSRYQVIVGGEIDVVLIYSETAGSWKGSCVGIWDQGKNHNKGETFDYTYDLNYRQGWNTELFTVSNNRVNLVVSGVTGPAPADAAWYYKDNR